MIPTKEEWEAALIERHGEYLHKAFSSATVAVCGLGGLGSNIAIALARAGVGRLILIDFDRVDITNLNRQQYMANQAGKLKTEALEENLREMAPYIELVTHSCRIDEKNAKAMLQDADVICEAFDSPEAKAMLLDVAATQMQDKIMVMGSGMAGLGKANDIRTKKLTSKVYISGDGEADTLQGMHLFAPRVMLCAAHEAVQTLRILAGKFEA